MGSRKPLEDTIFLCEEGSQGNVRRKFTIIRKIEAGASVICYEAYNSTSASGTLREFYPKNAYNLYRNKDGQLLCEEKYGEATPGFMRAMQEYMDAFSRLLVIKRENKDQDIDTFIPPFEIYRGCDQSGKPVGTAYIWCPDSPKVTFESICSQIHKYPTKEPEHKLIMALRAVETLTKCIRVLHSKGVIHCDIKPSNFGFWSRGNELLTQTLTMFDIDSFRSVFSESSSFMGTDGFMEPELTAGASDGPDWLNDILGSLQKIKPARRSVRHFPTIQTDIYAIGATLFYAVINCSETKQDGYLYRDSYYERIDEFVNCSKLIRASESNSHPRLCSILIRILRKCLAPRKKRYTTCEELLEDLKQALFYALPSEMAEKQKNGKEWMQGDVEKLLLRNREKNSLAMMQYHLYRHPLYTGMSQDEKEINVLLLGFGNYGQKFLDLCLQIGQVSGRKLRAVVVSADDSDKDIYISARPELGRFFHVDGSGDDGQDSYGSITFLTRRFRRDDVEENRNILLDLLNQQYRDRKLHHIFAAMGNDDLNVGIAGICHQEIRKRPFSCVIGFACEKDPDESMDKENKKESIIPVYVFGKARKQPEYEELERMAFNSHLIWEKDINTDFRKVRARYRKTYNHDSCISNVLSLKYKLFYAGIDLDQCSIYEAAQRFERECTGEKMNEMICAEHRRWTAEKVCGGWRPITDLEQCAEGLTKDEKRKRHVCIVRSAPARTLETEYWTANNCRNWDEAPDEMLAQLDELDRMSVKLHRVYVRRARALKEENFLSSERINSLLEIAKKDKRTMQAFYEWKSCMQDIWYGNMKKVRFYRGLEEKLIRSAGYLPKVQEKALKEQVRALSAVLYPLRAAAEYRDYKLDDVALVEEIPFILTYSQSACLAVPYRYGSPTDIFANIASASVAAPSRILFMGMIQDARELDKLKNSLVYTSELMKKRQLRSSAEFLLISTVPDRILNTDSLEDEFKMISGGRIRKTDILPASDLSAAVKKVKQKLAQKSARFRNFAVEYNHSQLSEIMYNSGFPEGMHRYRFDMNHRRFCDMDVSNLWLNYIKKYPGLTGEDLSVFYEYTQNTDRPEFFSVYRKIYAAYKKSPDIWKKMCSVLSLYAYSHDVVAVFPETCSETDSHAERLHYILPSVCRAAVQKILNRFIQHGLAGEGSMVSSYTIDSCETVIFDRCQSREIWDRLFANPYLLTDAESVDVRFDLIEKTAAVCFESLIVTDIPSGEYMDLLRYLSNAKLIIGLRVLNERVTFTYASKAVRALMTDAQRVSAVCMYHEFRESGKYDDVIGSVKTGSGHLQNICDCIAVRGFRTFWIKCLYGQEDERTVRSRCEKMAEKMLINPSVILIQENQIPIVGV